MRFLVPQFIEREPQIFGPFTFRQLLIVVGAGVICFFFYFLFGKTNFVLFFLLSIFVMGIALMIVFVKIGGQNFVEFILNVIRFSTGKRKYFWKTQEIFLVVSKQKKETERKGAQGNRLAQLRISKKIF